MDDLLILGGGVIGLSLAYDTAGRGLRVHLVERSQLGREASWAGAGILPPARALAGDPPLLHLAALSNELHAHWSDALREEAGIDNGYRRCGGTYLARSESSAGELRAQVEEWRRRGVAATLVDSTALAELEPNLAPMSPRSAAMHTSDEAQIRNPWHLRALEVACRRRGVRITEAAAAEDFVVHRHRVSEVVTSQERFAAGQVAICTGAWSAALAEKLGCQLEVKPIRGQMVLLHSPNEVLRGVVNEGSRYLVPRRDGYVLIGSTEEDVGFEKRNTARAVRDLLELATGLAPKLASATLDKVWSGLRPGSPGGVPVIGRVPELQNAFIAAGHYRAGLQLSPATAVVLSALIRGEKPPIDIAAIAPRRC